MKSPELFCLLAQVLKILVIRSSQKNPDFPRQTLQKEAAKEVFFSWSLGQTSDMAAIMSDGLRLPKGCIWESFTAFWKSES
jgi:hypothetical protein